jgi:NAD(P)H-nitrite reductase large subunit/Fe-S-cluster-containing hydrogenase component 2
MKRIVINEKYCLGCGLCEVHCLVQHSKSRKIIKVFREEKDKLVPGVRIERSGYHSFAVQCRHCDEAPCLEACMTGAMHRDPETGAVICDTEKCVGCWMCIMVCPLGAIRQGPDKTVASKCDLCIGEDFPACVANCPNEAITLEDRPRPLISYLLAGKVDESRMFYRPPDFYERNNIKALLGVEVTSIDAKRRVVETSEGQTLRFAKLLIATGGAPILPKDIKGIPGESRLAEAGIFTFTTWEDARNIQNYIEKKKVKKAVVVGGGLIGLKSVEALVALGIKTTVVELLDRILSATFDDTASNLAKKALGDAGVNVKCQTTVAKINRRDGRMTSVTMKDGTKTACDMLIFAIGVAPDKSLTKGTPIKTNRGILADDHLQTSVKGIYAAGDVAEADDLLGGKKRPIPIFPNAYRQGYVAGINMAGKERSYEGGIAMNSIDVCGVPTISVGVTSPDGDGYEVLSRLNEEDSTYKKIVLKDNRIVGAIFIGQIDRAGIITGLIKKKINVSGFKGLILTDEFGLISLVEGYRKDVMSGMGSRS